MEHLSNVLKALFAHQDGDEILKRANILKSDDYTLGRHQLSDGYLYKETSESTLMNLLQKVNLYNTIDQKSIIVQVFHSKWAQPDYSVQSLAFTEDATIYNGLLHFGLETLTIQDHDPTCRYHRLLRWHSLSTLLGEDIFTTSYLASRDVAANQKRDFFGWDAIIGHDNSELNALLSRPIADVHVHLKGSSFNFDLSWTSIMNNFMRMKEKFEELNEEYKESSDWDQYIYQKLQRAAVIRVYLAGIVGLFDTQLSTAEVDAILNADIDLSLTTSDRVADFLKIKNFEFYDLEFVQHCIDEKNDALLRTYGKKLLIPYDYLSGVRTMTMNNQFLLSEVLSSERKLLYLCFRKIFSSEKGIDNFATLFYAYLAYKSTFRQHILQLNEQVGFKNFSKFETRKDVFILEKYHKFLYSTAINHFLNNSSNRLLEVRITPQITQEKLRKSFIKITQSIQDSCNDYESLQRRFGIILHFIKARDEREQKGPRHAKLRTDIRQQCFATAKFRKDPKNWEKNPLAGLLIGIDAANSEIMCRPEVYGQAYRFLRGLSIKDSIGTNRPNDLRFTYHVGEDFLDVADGLRAVEEAIVFLGLRHGDRLGHGLVLGTDVAKYYEMRYFTICASKQVLIDNAAWLHHKCRRLGGSSKLIEYFECVFRKYFQEVYCGNIVRTKKTYYDFLSVNNDSDNIYQQHINGLEDINDYYLSWLIRGNNPKFGADIPKVLNHDVSDDLEKMWIEASLNHHPGAIMAMYNPNARELFDAYHREEVMDRGNEADTIHIPESLRKEFIELLSNIQEQLLAKLERLRVAIECNPTSNYKIGEMESYDEHPIFKFYNNGLHTPYKRHDLFVSINTDDLGVFSTSLDREYSLVALAAERRFCKDGANTPRQVVDWLNNIRKMSIEQSFINFEDINKYL